MSLLVAAKIPLCFGRRNGVFAVTAFRFSYYMLFSIALIYQWSDMFCICITLCSINHVWVWDWVWLWVWKNLIWSESAQWLLSSGVCNIPGVIITPMDMLMWPRWANGHGAAYLRTKIILILIWDGPAQRWLSYSVREVSRALLSLMGLPKWHPLAIGWCCTPAGHCGSNKLDLECIGPVVTDLPAHGMHSITPIALQWERRGTTSNMIYVPRLCLITFPLSVMGSKENRQHFVDDVLKFIFVWKLLYLDSGFTQTYSRWGSD